MLPVCLGGTNDTTNIVELTAREHYVAHHLLTKMHKGWAKRKMIFAFWSMAKRISPTQKRDYFVTNRQYENLKMQMAVALRDENLGKPSRNKGRTLSPEWREKLRQANLGKKRSEESKAKQAATMTGVKRPTRNSEWSAKIAAAKSTPEAKLAASNRMSQTLRGRKVIHNLAGDVKYVLLDDLDNYLHDGWILGRGFDPRTKVRQ